ncbi:MAG: hypothetical protein IJ683_04775 [Butyrivibrio sp.]|nr:hypothetical protein [Butyrivibrio sp.]MBR1641621.1 hypothetical protein [Butyrivibrio sp.]
MDEWIGLPDDYDFEKMTEEYTRSYNLLCEVNEPFHVKMKKIFDYLQIDRLSFEEKTGLHTKFFTDFQREGYIPRMSTFISMCMGLNLDLATAESLLASAKVAFDKTDRLHCAYIYLLTKHQGLNIEDCNKILKYLGYTEKKQLLGTFDKDSRRK